MADSAPGSPVVAIPFIMFNDATRKYELGPAAVSFLDGLSDKIGAFPLIVNARCVTERFAPRSWSHGAVASARLHSKLDVARFSCTRAGVVVVAGKYRGGKSFLMNQLVRANVVGGEGFGVGHTIASHTKGIWMWPKVVKAHTKAGEAIDVIVCDSEGLGATEAVRGVCLSPALSTLMITMPLSCSLSIVTRKSSRCPRCCVPC